MTCLGTGTIESSQSLNHCPHMQHIFRVLIILNLHTPWQMFLISRAVELCKF